MPLSKSIKFTRAVYSEPKIVTCDVFWSLFDAGDGRRMGAVVAVVFGGVALVVGVAAVVFGVTECPDSGRVIGGFNDC